ncbi:hypothetical protein [Vibrio parahaemolyticus]|uniref:hypothetical protein n=3 Tax=Vibrio parahaemolyticus TaxID=670 RepID=UPI000A1FB756|nr:hypothetical protein [Vibrio parahaemolyticus]AWG83643.1 hypothetical protein Vp2S01_1303 [Vibrio parahaemolyticus]EGR1755061.1 hypothetical protein [Vibrio parahaemolyticus]ELB2095397.1 hypothetical protein [Vibrio parahaemolyticus]ELB2127386.1 hypothetical protein [Vibrio parahaemolyticus]MBX5339144.1 hypothetical protein [Vibrio parahaemolyticus]
MRVLLSNLLRMLKRILSIRFWLVVFFTICMGVVLGWLISGVLIEHNIISRYKALPEIVKNFTSVEDTWIGMLISTSLPMFLLFSLQFHTLRIKLPFDVRYYLFKALPYIKHLKWLSNKPTVFFVFTASIILGCVLYLGVLGSLHYLIGLIIPIILYTLAAMLHKASSDILGGSKLSKFTYTNNHAIGNFCLFISAFMWLYSSVLKPYQDFSAIVNYLM